MRVGDDRDGERRRGGFGRAALWTLALTAGLLAVGAGGVVAYGRERLLADLFGDPDTGAYDFAAPTRTPVPHDALACPAAACEAARPDLETLPDPRPPATVFSALRAAAAALPGPDFVAEDTESLAFRAVVRTPWIRFADTLSARVEARPDGGSAVWIYSRSQIGRGDWGTNRARLEAVLRAAGVAYRAAGG